MIRLRSALTIAILLGSLCVPPVASAKDPNVVIDENLAGAVLLTQQLMASASQGCGGGQSGVAPVGWQGRQASGVAAQNALNDLRIALAKKETQNSLKLIDLATSKLREQIGALRESCSGGSNGQDPPAYGAYVSMVTTATAKLAVIRQLLEP